MRFGKAIVRGFSMVPTLGDRDQLLISYGAPYKVGDVIVFKHQSRIDIKRIENISNEGIFVVGDNELASLDSRSYGYISPGEVLGRAIFRISPNWGRIPNKGTTPKKRRRRLKKRPWFWRIINQGGKQ